MAVKKAAPERAAYLAQLAHACPSPALARMYGTAMAAVARKSVLRLSRATKARFCKRCFAPLGVETCRWRVEDESRRQNRPVLVCTCQCGRVRRQPLYKLSGSAARSSEPAPPQAAEE